MNRPCSIDGCSNAIFTLRSGLCGKHYMRKRIHGDPHVNLRPELELSLMERFWRKVNKQLKGCWLWLASTNQDGYGHLNVGGKLTPAHRFAYEQFIGPIPDGMCVMHACDIPACVNPQHLSLGTHADNMQDKKKKGRARRSSPKRAAT